MGQKNVKNDIWTNGRASSLVIRANHELRECYRDLDTVADVKKKRLEWIEHVVRMDQGRAVCLFVYTTTHSSLKAYCPILVRRSTFRHQASPRVSPRESTQRRKVELWARNVQ